MFSRRQHFESINWPFVVSRNRLDALSLNDVHGDGERAKNGEANGERNASLHWHVEALVSIYTFLCEGQENCLQKHEQAQKQLHFRFFFRLMKVRCRIDCLGRRLEITDNDLQQEPRT
jgi:hypothetical protein